MGLLDSSVDIICSYGFNYRQFRTFSADICSESCDMPYRNVHVVQWLSSGRLLSRLPVLGKEMDVFLHEKN